MPYPKPHIALIGSNSLMLSGLQTLLQEIIPFARIELYPDGHAFAASAPDVVFHLFVTPSAYAACPNIFLPYATKIILLSCGEPEADIPPALRRIDMLQPRDVILRQLLIVQQHAHHNFNLYPNEIAQRLHQQDQLLSPREIEVLRLLARGHINKEIADQLNISINTVITHRKNIMQKLHSQSLSKLAVYAVTHGYIKAEEIK